MRYISAFTDVKLNYKGNKKSFYHEKILILILIGRYFLKNISVLWLLCSVFDNNRNFQSTNSYGKQLLHYQSPLGRERKQQQQKIVIILQYQSHLCYAVHCIGTLDNKDQHPYSIILNTQQSNRLYVSIKIQGVNINSKNSTPPQTGQQA